MAFAFGLQTIKQRPNMVGLQNLINNFYKDRDVDPKFKIVFTDFAKFQTQLSSGGINKFDVPLTDNVFNDARNKA